VSFFIGLPLRLNVARLGATAAVPVPWTERKAVAEVGARVKAKARAKVEAKVKAGVAAAHEPFEQL